MPLVTSTSSQTLHRSLESMDAPRAKWTIRGICSSAQMANERLQKIDIEPLHHYPASVPPWPAPMSIGIFDGDDNDETGDYG